MEQEVVIRFKESTLKTLREMPLDRMVHFSIGVYYDEFPAEAKMFETEMGMVNELIEGGKVNAMKLNGKIPTELYTIIRFIDETFWKDTKNYEMFFKIFQIGKTKRARRFL